jgi:hypothetical protein
MTKSAATRPICSEQNAEVHMDDRDDRIARLESDVAHIRSDISRIEGDVREIRGDIKGLKGEVADLRTEMRTEFATLRLEMEKMKSSNRIAFVVLGVIQLAVAAGAPQAVVHGLRLVAQNEKTPSVAPLADEHRIAGSALASTAHSCHQVIDPSTIERKSSGASRMMLCPVGRETTCHVASFLSLSYVDVNGVSLHPLA